MRILTRHLQHGDACLWSLESDDCVLIACGMGGTSTFGSTGEASGVWIPLRGTLRIHRPKLIDVVHTRELLVAEHHAETTAHVRGVWLAILADTRAWEPLVADTPAAVLHLLPDHCGADHTVRRLAVALARAAPGFEQECAMRDLVDLIVALQTPLRDTVSRCPGRTLVEKRRVFVRLQRVRHFIRACCQTELDNPVLASMANYSTSHFLHTFNTVFHETPHAYLVNQRLQRAAHLLHAGTMAVTEVALASGFENASTFSRLFHQRFGITAIEARRQCGATEGSAPPLASRIFRNGSPDSSTSRRDPAA